eukprot:2661138-Pleurochrysis_carterae.AAC.2
MVGSGEGKTRSACRACSIDYACANRLWGARATGRGVQEEQRPAGAVGRDRVRVQTAQRGKA